MPPGDPPQPRSPQEKVREAKGKEVSTGGTQTSPREARSMAVDQQQ